VSDKSKVERAVRSAAGKLGIGLLEKQGSVLSKPASDQWMVSTRDDGGEMFFVMMDHDAADETAWYNCFGGYLHKKLMGQDSKAAENQNILERPSAAGVKSPVQGGEGG
jgi:hypothetical protein